jgi:hypothetical protein
MILASRLIEEAWAHRRHRHRILGAAGAAVVIGALAITGLTGLTGGDSVNTSQPSGPVNAPESALLVSSTVSLEPVAHARASGRLSEHCVVINSVTCDSFFVGFRLKQSATSVIVSIAGRTVQLRPTVKAERRLGTRQVAGRAYRSRTVFTGALLPYALARLPIAHQQRIELPPKPRDGVPLPRVKVKLLITYGNGRRVRTQFWRTASRGYDLTMSPQTGAVIKRLNVK